MNWIYNSARKGDGLCRKCSEGRFPAAHRNGSQHSEGHEEFEIDDELYEEIETLCKCITRLSDLKHIIDDKLQVLEHLSARERLLEGNWQ